MSTRNFADPDYEPTDEDLAELMHEAFAGVREANERALAALEEQVVAQRAVVLAHLAASSKDVPRTRAFEVCADDGRARLARPRNFADPEYEPTDEDLAELMHEAFAGVGEANKRALAGLRDQVEIQRANVLARLAASSRAGRDQ